MAGRILISGGGIAGLTLGVLLKERGFDPLVIEQDPALRTAGYMMDFFGTGWDVAERMGLTEALRAIRYPIDALQYVDADGRPYIRADIDVVRRALRDRYVYLRRSDLERILFERAQAAKVDVRFGTSIRALDQSETTVAVEFEDGSTDTFTLVIGADGVHSRVRELAFGPEEEFARFLGYYVAAFHLDDHHYAVGGALNLYEETNRLVAAYPLDARRLDATYVFRHADVGIVPHRARLALVREAFAGGGWIAEAMLDDHPANEPPFFDSTTQIVMPQWHQGRVALIGDACGALTLLAGQGSHMAMGGAWVLAEELGRHRDDHRVAFAAYQAKLKPEVEKRQREAARLARLFVPTERSRPWLRRMVTGLLFTRPLLRLAFRAFGGTSILAAPR